MSSAKLIEVIKLAGLQAAEASKPVNIFEGKVVRANPLEVEIERTNRVNSDFLEVSERLTDHFEYMTSVENDFEDIKDKSKYEARKKYIVYSGLKAGDKVILARKAGGQKYFVIDRAGETR